MSMRGKTTSNRAMGETARSMRPARKEQAMFKIITKQLKRKTRFMCVNEAGKEIGRRESARPYTACTVIVDKIDHWIDRAKDELANSERALQEAQDKDRASGVEYWTKSFMERIRNLDQLEGMKQDGQLTYEWVYSWNGTPDLARKGLGAYYAPHGPQQIKAVVVTLKEQS